MSIKKLLSHLWLVCAIVTLPSSIVANPTYQYHPAPVAHSAPRLYCHTIRERVKGTKRIKVVTICRKPKTFQEKMDLLLSSLAPSTSKETIIQRKIEAAKQVSKTPSAISLFEPTYVLPLYYTGTPYQAVYINNTPENQRIQQEEFKAQMSFLFTVWHNMFKSPLDLNISYTQLSFWQFYAKSQWFRETDYEPAIFVSDQFSKNVLGYFGVVHQSNGRGGELERSWNRAFAWLITSGDHWLVGVEPWILIFQKDSSDLHNPDIADFLGYGRIIFAFTFYHQELSFMFRNTVESGFKRGAIEIGYSVPVYSKIRFYFQFFSGYGQSLIEYNHYTNGVGVGIALNDWI